MIAGTNVKFYRWFFVVSGLVICTSTWVNCAGTTAGEKSLQSVKAKLFPQILKT